MHSMNTHTHTHTDMIVTQWVLTLLDWCQLLYSIVITRTEERGEIKAEYSGLSQRGAKVKPSRTSQRNTTCQNVFLTVKESIIWDFCKKLRDNLLVLILRYFLGQNHVCLHKVCFRKHPPEVIS